MASPITLETLVGYISEEDVYIRFTEYYGDGTIYGRTELSMPDGSPVKGSGKFKKELVEAGVLMSETVAGSLTGDLVVVQNEAPVEVPAPVEPPAEVPAEVPASPPEKKKCTVVMSILGFKVSREYVLRMDDNTNTLFLEDV